VVLVLQQLALVQALVVVLVLQLLALVLALVVALVLLQLVQEQAPQPLVPLSIPLPS
jgi:hypothetical protein